MSAPERQQFSADRQRGFGPTQARRRRKPRNVRCAEAVARADRETWFEYGFKARNRTVGGRRRKRTGSPSDKNCSPVWPFQRRNKITFRNCGSTQSNADSHRRLWREEERELHGFYRSYQHQRCLTHSERGQICHPAAVRRQRMLTISPDFVRASSVSSRSTSVGSD
jgi:hypothetical protein